MFEDEYDLMESPGEGADAIVYKARHKKLGYIRAIKVLNRFIQNEDDPKYKKFIEECKTLLRLGNGGHKNIVGITRPRLLHNRAVVEMDFVQGKDVDEFLDSSQRFLPVQEVLNLMVDISDALSYCHYSIFSYCIDPNEDPCVTDVTAISKECERMLVQKYKVIHNDIHSRNIRRRTDGRYVLLDFGLAIEQGTQIKSSIRKAGAVEYKAPEKWDENEITFTEQGDIYSFGVLMYEVLAGTVPFPFDKKKPEQIAVFEVMNHHKHSIPEPIEPRRRAAFERTHNTPWKKDYPEWMERVIMKCLEKDPARRYANGKELFEEIQGYLDHTKEQTAAMQKLDEVVNTKEYKTMSDAYSRVNEKLTTENKTLQQQLEAARVRERQKDRQLEAAANNRSHSNAVLVYIVLAACLLTAFGTYYYFFGRNKTSYRQSPAVADKITIYGSKDYGVRFYRTAAFDSPKDAMITTRETVPVLKDSNGFVFIIFTNSNKVETQGWINKEEASEEGARRGKTADSLIRRARAALKMNNYVAAISLYNEVQEIRPREEIRTRIDQLNAKAQALADRFENLIEQARVEYGLSDCDETILPLYDSVLKLAIRPHIRQLKDSCEAANR